VLHFFYARELQATSFGELASMLAVADYLLAKDCAAACKDAISKLHTEDLSLEDALAGVDMMAIPSVAFVARLVADCGVAYQASCALLKLSQSRVNHATIMEAGCAPIIAAMRSGTVAFAENAVSVLQMLAIWPTHRSSLIAANVCSALAVVLTNHSAFDVALGAANTLRKLSIDNELRGVVAAVAGAALVGALGHDSEMMALQATRAVLNISYSSNEQAVDDIMAAGACAPLVSLMQFPYFRWTAAHAVCKIIDKACHRGLFAVIADFVTAGICTPLVFNLFLATDTTDVAVRIISFMMWHTPVAAAALAGANAIAALAAVARRTSEPDTLRNATVALFTFAGMPAHRDAVSMHALPAILAALGGDSVDLANEAALALRDLAVRSADADADVYAAPDAVQARIIASGAVPMLTRLFHDEQIRTSARLAYEAIFAIVPM
jgi:hypothetical protein